eukprot:gene23441-biopygen6534
MVASAERWQPVVELLCAAGSDVDAANQFGQTALKLALHHGHENIVERLLSFGARPDAVDRAKLKSARLLEQAPGPPAYPRRLREQ